MSSKTTAQIDKCKHLLYHSQQVLDTFPMDTKSIDSHINEYLLKLKDCESDDKIFITEVFSGIVQYQKVLNVVIQGFYNTAHDTALHSDINVYKIFTFLIIFRLEELGIHNITHFIEAFDQQKIYNFLFFFINHKNIQSWIKDEWIKLYDRSFVENEFLVPLLRYTEDLEKIIKKLGMQLSSGQKTKKKEAIYTDIKPFNITQPRPRSVPFPEVIPAMEEFKPPSKTLYMKPKEEMILKTKRNQNRLEAEARKKLALKISPTCANVQKSEKTLNTIQKVLDEREDELDFERHKANDAPNFAIKNNIPVKLNTAAILREWNRYKTEENSQVKKLTAIEAGEFDKSEFESWQSVKREEDLANALIELERRRLAGQLSYEDAILARKQLQENNRLVVENLKLEAKKRMQKFAKQKLEEQQVIKRIVEQVMSTQNNARLAQIEVQEYKASIVAQVAKESQQLLKEALEEAELELKRKIKLIQEIRAFEAQPVIRDKLVDLASTAGYGFLSEMSIAELRERLALCKSMETKQREEKCDTILEEKQNKNKKLMDAVEIITKYRAENTRAAAKKLEASKRQERNKSILTTNNAQIHDLQNAIEERRARRKQEKNKNLDGSAADGTGITSSNRFINKLNNEKKVRQNDFWAELELSQERAAKLRAEKIRTD